MSFKEKRRIKVTEQPGGYLINEKRPAIKLQGKWLEDFFQVGEYVNIQCDKENNCLIITKEFCPGEFGQGCRRQQRARFSDDD